MDERIRQEYHRIYSEMYLIILGMCTISLIAKIMFLEKSLSDCWLEYLILVGSPIYRLIRCRMLNVILPAEHGQRQWIIRLISSIIVCSALFCLAMYIRTGRIATAEILLFMIPFIALFLLVMALSFFIRKQWQKKMEDKYNE